MKRSLIKTSVQETLVKSNISEEPNLLGWVPVVLHRLLHKFHRGVQPRRHIHCWWTYLVSAPASTALAHCSI